MFHGWLSRPRRAQDRAAELERTKARAVEPRRPIPPVKFLASTFWIFAPQPPSLAPPHDCHHARPQQCQVGQWLTLLCYHPYRPTNPTACSILRFIPYSDSCHLNHLRMIGNIFLLLSLQRYVALIILHSFCSNPSTSPSNPFGSHRLTFLRFLCMSNHSGMLDLVGCEELHSTYPLIN